MKLRIEIEPQATAQLDELDLWWREHRPDSRTPYKLYYNHEPGGEVLSVIAVWSGMRGVGPSLTGR